MINKVIRYSSNEIIDVLNIEVIENEYKLKKFKTLLINNSIKLIQRDRVEFRCLSCGKEVYEKFAFNLKFFSNECNCRECDFTLTKIIKYGSPNAVSQIKKGINIKYGVDNVSKLDFVKTKKENTFMKRYGVKNNFARKEVKDTMYDINGKYLNNREKSIETVRERYGVDNVSQLDSVKEQKEKTCFKNYGVNNPLKSIFIKEKYKATCVLKYGVEHISQNRLIHNKQMKSIRSKFNIKEINENLHYQTKLELSCIYYCLFNEIDIWDGPSIKYSINSKEHIYFVDFETNSYIIEIKSNHFWYKQDLESGEIEAKNAAATHYAKSINKEFLFLLDINDYGKYIVEKNNVN